ncbi:intein-containing Rv2578c family radical SAM protein [Promicromonospora sukumoe]|uniref:intein-containing Rv2578c family radical SAM protein n=1 Tax=Promicromonospora sukumoe TaxID=88382 RepID=UPI0003828C6B|nr:intein-containing Rv2578c family radical SAM protein [Promicromonospora sukumoe]
MRWQGQAISNDDDGALPGLELPALRGAGLLRTVRSPEFAGVTFHEVLAKSALSKVPAASQMPFRWTVNPYRGCSHACTYCVDPSTLVLMADGRQKPIRDLVVGDRIVGTERDGAYRRFVETEVLARRGTTKTAYRVTLEDGTEIVASADHRFLTERGWKYVAPLPKGEGQRPYLTTNNRLQGFGLGMVADAYASPPESVDYRQGYLTGMIRGDGMLFDKTYPSGRITMFRLALVDGEALTRSQDYLAEAGVPTNRRLFSAATERRQAIDGIFTSKRATVAAIRGMIEWPGMPTREWHAGFLAGIFDAEGSCDGQILRIANSDERMLSMTTGAMDVLRIPYVREPANKIGVANIRVIGGLSSRRRFFALTNPAITRKLKIIGAAVKTSVPLRIVSVENLGTETEMVDITTGTADFIANGVISHNCFARPTHEYLDLDAGHDFDSQVVVKVNADQVLRAELAKQSWSHEPVALGTNTDPYQRAEGRYKLMPGIISALADSGTPFSILTKGTLLRRDLPLITEAAQRVDVGLGVSLAFADTPHGKELQQAVEPGTPTPKARLDLIRAIRAAGLPCGVMVAPVLPWLTDSLAHLERLLDNLVDAGATGVTVLPLHLRPGAREWYLGWLERSHPHLVEGYGRVYARGAYAHKGYRDWLWERVRPLIYERGLGGAAMHRVGDDQHAEGDYPRGAFTGVRADGAGAASLTADVGSETLF